MSKPCLPDIQTYVQLGINPATGLPYKLGATPGLEYPSKQEFKKTLRIADEQIAVNRYVWYNLPSGLDTQLMERILFYRGRGALFYMPTDNTFYFLPYALEGNIDVYARATGITPVPFGGGVSQTEGKKERPWITGLVKTPKYQVIQPEELTEDILDNSCVLLNDYTPQISQTIIPRAVLQEPYLEFLSDMLPFTRTALLSGTGVSAIRVNSEDEQSNVDAASRSINRAALVGQKWIPIIGQVDFQDLTGGTLTRAEDFLLAMQSVDNIRLSMYGLGDGMILEKKAHMLQSEANMNQSNISLILQDGLINRQRFCDIANSIWGLGIWCDVAESAIGVDKNLDGQAIDELDQSGAQEGEQPLNTIGGEE